MKFTCATLIDNILIKSDLHETHRSNVLISNISDHYPSILAIDNPDLSKVESHLITTRTIKDTELTKIKNKLNETDWGAELNPLNANEALNKFHNKLIATINNIAPEKTIKIRTRRNIPWFTLGIKKSNDKDKKLFKIAQGKAATKAQIEKYKDYHKTLQKTKRLARQTYYRNLCTEFRYNSQKLWRIINSISGKNNNKHDIIDCLKVDNIEIHKQMEIASVFAKHFSNVGKRFATKIPASNRTSDDYLNSIPSSNVSLFLTPTTPIEIFNLVSKLPTKKVLDMTP